MAAAARPPGIGDARVACPACGGLIHPVAGRCKHCKEDLSALRTNRPQAAAVLPALNGKTIAVPVAGNGTSVHTAAPAAVPIAVPLIDSAPILPQRPTGRSMSAQRPRGSLLRNWPMIVIILAMIAIVTAVVIMVLPNDNKGSGGKRQLMPAPAPERMETNPKGTDPWSGPTPTPPSNPGISPSAPDPQPRVTPDPPDPDDTNDPDPDDLLGGLGPNTFGGTLGGGGGTFLFTLADAACKKVKTCPGVDSSTVDGLCMGLSTFPRPSNQCARGQKCVEAIERMDCDALSGSQAGNPITAMVIMQDCAQAITEC